MTSARPCARRQRGDSQRRRVSSGRPAHLVVGISGETDVPNRRDGLLLGFYFYADFSLNRKVRQRLSVDSVVLSSTYVIKREEGRGF